MSRLNPLPWIYLALLLALVSVLTWRPLYGYCDFWAHAAVGRWTVENQAGSPARAVPVDFGRAVGRPHLARTGRVLRPDAGRRRLPGSGPRRHRRPVRLAVRHRLAPLAAVRAGRDAGRPAVLSGRRRLVRPLLAAPRAVHQRLAGPAVRLPGRVGRQTPETDGVPAGPPVRPVGQPARRRPHRPADTGPHCDVRLVARPRPPRPVAGPVHRFGRPGDDAQPLGPGLLPHLPPDRRAHLRG